MAQAILDIHASASDSAALGSSQPDLVEQRRCGVDTRYTYANTLSRMERDFERILLRGLCSVEGCTFSNQRWIRLQQHVESHHIF